MVTINIEYLGDLRCKATHGPSGRQILTDAPTDNQGKGEFFSPTDLIATALGSCMLTIMGIVAQKNKFDLTGASVAVTKEMASSPPRKIETISVTFTIPMPLTPEQKKMLEQAARTCPVHLTLGQNVHMPITFNWTAK
jgi:putative redox protein